MYIITLDNGENHLIKAGENDIDILTKEEISGKKIKITCFKNTSVFYNLYQDGIIINPDIVLNTHILKQYVDAWDGQFQEAIPELKASNIATEKMK